MRGEIEWLRRLVGWVRFLPLSPI